MMLDDVPPVVTRRPRKVSEADTGRGEGGGNGGENANIEPGPGRRVRIFAPQVADAGRHGHMMRSPYAEAAHFLVLQRMLSRFRRGARREDSRMADGVVRAGGLARCFAEFTLLPDLLLRCPPDASRADIVGDRPRRTRPSSRATAAKSWVASPHRRGPLTATHSPTAGMPTSSARSPSTQTTRSGVVAPPAFAP